MYYASAPQHHSSQATHFEIKIYVEVGSGLVTGFAIEEN
jgi:hypothetical protein